MDTINKSNCSSIEELRDVWIKNLDKMKERLKSHYRESASGLEGIREMKLYHGLKLISSAPLMGHFLAICYRHDTQEYLVLTGTSTIERFSIQGKPIQPSFILSSTMTFTKFIWCEGIQMLVGFLPHDDLIWILDSTLKLNQVIRNEFRIEEVFYTSHSNEIVVVGLVKVTRFPMEHTERTLNPWKAVNVSDVSYGPTWKVDYSSLIDCDPDYLKLAGSYLNTLYVIPLICEKDEDSNVPVKFIARKTNATEAVITALYFHSMSQWTICGDQQGNITAWNLYLESMMTCPFGHCDSVKMIIGHPAICGFISSGKDNILQVWSCNLKGKIESFNYLGEISHMALSKSASSVATLGTKLTCLQMHQLYNFYSPLSEKAVQVISTSSLISITHIIAHSNDGIARMLSAQSGQQMNLYTFSNDSLPTAIAHSLITGNIYMVENARRLLVIDTNIQPMKIIDTWNIKDKSLTCIAVYDHYEKVRNMSDESSRSSIINSICVWILVGTITGELITIDEKNAQNEIIMPAHDGKITKLQCSMSYCHVISIGIDKSLRIWRMLPDIKMPLTLLDCVYYENIITDIALFGLTICLVSSSQFSTIHKLLMYNIAERKHLEHHPSKDHTNLILAVDSLEHLAICASSSMDTTIRIWNNNNDLLKILQINICIEQMVFSSFFGDIVFGAGKHLYRIPYKNYLSSNYSTGVDSATVKKQEMTTSNIGVFNDDDEEELNVEKLQPVSSVPLGSLDPNVEGPRIDSMLKHQMCMQLKYRDEDVLRIKNNDLHAKKTVKMKALLEHYDWERHLCELSVLCKRIDEEITSAYDVFKCRQKYQSRKGPTIPKDTVKELPTTDKALTDNLYFYQDVFIPNSSFINVSGRHENTYKSAEIATPIDYNRDINNKPLIKYIYPVEKE